MEKILKSNSDYNIIPLSAINNNDMANYINKISKFLALRKDVKITDLAYTYQTGRKHFKYRSVIVTTEKELKKSDLEKNRITTQERFLKESVKIAFMFTGQASQYTGMAKELYNRSPLINQIINKGNEILKDQYAYNLVDYLFKSNMEDELNKTEITQPALYVIEYALAKLWLSINIRPDIMIGHSLGEYVAAAISGAMTFEEGLLLVAKRGELMAQYCQNGCMISVLATYDEISEYLDENIEVSVINASNRIVLSGSSESMNNLCVELKKKEIKFVLLNTSNAFHSKYVEPMISPFREVLSQIDFKPLSIPMVSNVTGDIYEAGDILSTEYWIDHLRKTVQFDKGIQSMEQIGINYCIEIGVDHVLQKIVRNRIHTVGSMKKGKSDILVLYNALGDLWCNGVELNWTVLYSGADVSRIHVPTYPFSQKTYKLNRELQQMYGEVKEKKQISVKKINREDPAESIDDIIAEILGKEVSNKNMTFIELGGDSLIALQFASRIRESFQIDFSLENVFMKTINELIDYIKDLLVKSGMENKTQIPHYRGFTDYPLTPAQQQMYFLTETGKNKSLYNLPGCILLHGKLNTTLFQKAIQTVIENNEQFRAVFHIAEFDVRQQIIPEITYNCQVFHVIEEYKKYGNKLILKLIEEEETYVFDLEHGPLFSFKLFQLTESMYCFVMNLHHIIFDSHSMSIFLSDLDYSYNQLTKGEKIESCNNKLKYTDYAMWMEEQKNSESYLVAKNYWGKQFSGDIPKMRLPVEHFTNRITGDGGSQKIMLEDVTVKKLRQYTKQLNITTYQALFGAFIILLYNYTGQKDIVVGTSSTGRMKEETKQVIGMFANTIPIYVSVEFEEKIEDFYHLVKQTLLDGVANQIYPFNKIVEDIRVKKEVIDENAALFNVFFSLEHPLEMENWTVCNCKADSMDFLSTRALFDLSLNISESQNEIGVEITYNKSLFNVISMTKWLNNYSHLINNIVNKIGVRIKDFEIISQAEMKYLLQDYNDTAYAMNGCVVITDLIRRQINLTPENIAISYQDKNVTYNQLENMTVKFMNILSSNSEIKNKPVAIFMDRSVEMIVSILAVLRLGGHYIPIDPKYPDGRIKTILEITQYPLLITQSKYDDKLSQYRCLSFQESNDSDMKVSSNIEDCSVTQEKIDNIRILENDLAYIIFTSGSTGKPKGVMINHKGLANYIIWAAEYYDAKNSGDFPLYSSIAFDLTITSIFIPLVTGHTIFIQPNYLEGMELISHMVDSAQIASIKITPAHFEIIIQFAKLKNKTIKALKHIIVGGEPLAPLLVEEWFKYYPDTIIYNEYGPTETVVGCIVHKLTKNDVPINNQYVPIGRPISNTRIYILNKDKKMVPIGTNGEIYIGGAGVANGYYANEELTKQSFLKLPFDTDTLYKTGDMARFRYDGIVEHLGRIDTQIKIRGYRIELGEIEQSIMMCAGVKNAVVIDYSDQTKKQMLLAYYTADILIDKADIIKNLANSLPVYMRPNYFMQLKELPITINGKVDRKQLIELYEKKDVQKADNVKNMKEEQPNVHQIVIKTWGEILNTNITDTDNFFNLGGNSLMVLPMYVKLKKMFPNLEINDIFEHPNLQEFVEYLKDITYGNSNWESFNDNSTKSIPISLPKVQSASNYNNSIDIKNILLTGATGFLGSHLLHEIIKYDKGKIYCLIRMKNGIAPKKRLEQILSFYFGDKNMEKIMNRVCVLEGDIEKDQLGLSEEEYTKLVQNIDSILHCAADVRHYGSKGSNSETNINGTERLIKLAASRKGISFNYISTISIANEIPSLSGTDIIYEERFKEGEELDNDYLKSKYLSECLVYKAHDNGIPASVFRVGNLVGNSVDGKFQQNIESNAFYSLLKGIVMLEAAPDEHSNVELTPIDYCSKAISYFVFKNKEYGKIYHICNPTPVKFNELITMIQSLFYQIMLLKPDIFHEFLFRDKDDMEHNKLCALILMGYSYSEEEKVIYNCQNTLHDLLDTDIKCPLIDKKLMFTLFQYMISIDYVPEPKFWEWISKNYDCVNKINEKGMIRQ